MALFLSFLRSPLWRVPLDAFVDAHSLSFTPHSEHSFSHTTIHSAYTTLAESLLNQHLALLSIPSASLPGLLSSVLSPSAATSASDRRLLEELLTLDDYIVFHARMVRRNVELDREVLEGVLKEEKEKERVRRNKDKERERQRGAQASEDDEVMRVAIALSLMEEEQRKKESEREQADLDYAIALSLALQAQQSDVAPSRAAQPARLAQSGRQAEAATERQKHAEEHKDAEASTTAPIVKAPSVTSSSASPPSSGSSSRRGSGPSAIVLGPLRNLRRTSLPLSTSTDAPSSSPASADGSAIATPPLSSSPDPFSAADLQAKAEFLRAQRSILLARKQKKGEEELKAFERDVRDDSEQRASVSGQVPGDAKRSAMQRALRERLRLEAERTIAQRTEQRELDERKAEELQRVDS